MVGPFHWSPKPKAQRPKLLDENPPSLISVFDPATVGMLDRQVTSEFILSISERSPGQDEGIKGNGKMALKSSPAWKSLNKIHKLLDSEALILYHCKRIWFERHVKACDQRSSTCRHPIGA